MLDNIFPTTSFLSFFRGGQLRHVGEPLQLQTNQVSLRVGASVQRGMESGHAALLQIHGLLIFFFIFVTKIPIKQYMDATGKYNL
jgi:hypothetical protein